MVENMTLEEGAEAMLHSAWKDLLDLSYHALAEFSALLLAICFWLRDK